MANVTFTLRLKWSSDDPDEGDRCDICQDDVYYVVYRLRCVPVDGGKPRLAASLCDLCNSCYQAAVLNED